MRLLVNCSIVALILLCSCTNDKEEKIYQALDNGFASSYKSINQQNQIILASLESKKWEPTTTEKATIWHEKALAIKQASDAMMEYIEKLKSIIEKGKEKTNELYDSLEKYKLYVLNIDPIIKQEFYNNSSLVDSSLKDDGKALEGDISLPVLSYFQNNIAITESKLLSFCHDQTARVALICMQNMPIVFQNTKYARPGDPIEISIGIGQFQHIPEERITIAGENIALNESAVGIYKIKAPKEIGKHTYPVRIEYKDQDAKLQVVQKTVEFTVMK